MSNPNIADVARRGGGDKTAGKKWMLGKIAEAIKPLYTDDYVRWVMGKAFDFKVTEPYRKRCIEIKAQRIYDVIFGRIMTATAVDGVCVVSGLGKFLKLRNMPQAAPLINTRVPKRYFSSGDGRIWSEGGWKNFKSERVTATAAAGNWRGGLGFSDGAVVMRGFGAGADFYKAGENVNPVGAGFGQALQQAGAHGETLLEYEGLWRVWVPQRLDLVGVQKRSGVRSEWSIDSQLSYVVRAVARRVEWLGGLGIDVRWYLTDISTNIDDYKAAQFGAGGALVDAEGREYVSAKALAAGDYLKLAALLPHWKENDHRQYVFPPVDTVPWSDSFNHGVNGAVVGGFNGMTESHMLKFFPNAYQLFVFGDRPYYESDARIADNYAWSWAVKSDVIKSEADRLIYGHWFPKRKAAGEFRVLFEGDEGFCAMVAPGR